MPDIDIFGNGGANSAQLSQPTAPQGNPSPMPASGTGNPLIDQLVQKLAQTTQLQKQVIMPQQLPPQVAKAGDVSGNFVNPSTAGGPKHNAKVSLAQSIGNVVAQGVNAHEEKEARDLAFEIRMVKNNMDTLNDPNASPEDKALAKEQLNNVDKATWKKIAKATDIKFGPVEDKRTNVEKQAVQMAQKADQQGGQQQGGSGQQQQGGAQNPPMQEKNGIPTNMGLNPMAAGMMRALPTQPGLSPAAQATAELVKSGVLPSASDIMKYASDQNYYKVLEQKMGVEAATKMAAIQEKAETDANKAALDIQKMTNQKEIADAKLALSEQLHAAYNGIQEQRLALMKDNIDRLSQKDADTAARDAKKLEVDTLGKQSKSLGDQAMQLNKAKAAAQKIASTGIFSSEKQRKAAADIQDIDQKMQRVQVQQKAVNDSLNSLGNIAPPAQNNSGGNNQPTFDDIWKSATPTPSH